MDLGLRGRACIVTGASRGIGRATAKALVVEGAAVLLVARTAEPLHALATECRDAGGEAGALALDVTEPKAGEAVVNECLERYGRIDVLVNNAGTSAVRALNDLTEEHWQEQWELNVLAPMRLMRAAAPAMAARGWGRIVNVSSSSGKRPSSTNMAYSVTKAAELSLSRSFAELFANEGVLVNAIAPGATATELWTGAGMIAEQTAAAQGISRDDVLAAVAARIPLGRFGAESEIAAVIAFLCSEAAAYVTGAAWSVDGGAVQIIV